MSVSENTPSEQHLTTLAAAALPYWSMDDARVELIKIRENAVYKITSADGTRYALRVHRANYHTDEALRSEFAWMCALNDADIHTPQIISAKDGDSFKHIATDEIPDGRQVDILSWVDAPALGSIEEGFADNSDIQSAFSIIGSLAARMHNQVESWQLPASFSRGSFDIDGLTGENPRWGRFWECPLLDTDGRNLALTCRDRLRDDLTAFGMGKDRFGLIHADLLPENLLISDNDIRVIDFDDSGFGWHMFDLSTSLFFHLGEAYFDDALEALVKGYRQHRPLSDEHLALLPMFLTARGSTYLGWMQTRPGSKEAKTIGPEIAVGVTELIKNYLQTPALE